jgi:TrmH family RNA methyltransferase
MITKTDKKLIKSLTEKKNRNELGLFLVEGEKSVRELLNSDFEITSLFVTKEFFDVYGNTFKNIPYEIIDQEELEKLGTLESNDSAIGIAKQKNTELQKTEGIILALDTVQDPGNLGTIIRIADWYGIKHIIASEGTTDFYNSKVIGASMGSFSRVQVSYTDLQQFLSETTLPVLGAYLEGTDIHTVSFPQNGILIMGNESKGISSGLEKFITQKITIPSYGKAESLNVGVATAVILDTWKHTINL